MKLNAKFKLEASEVEGIRTILRSIMEMQATAAAKAGMIDGEDSITVESEIQTVIDSMIDPREVSVSKFYGNIGLNIVHEDDGSLSLTLDGEIDAELFCIFSEALQAYYGMITAAVKVINPQPFMDAIEKFGEYKARKIEKSSEAA